MEKLPLTVFSDKFTADIQGLGQVQVTRDMNGEVKYRVGGVELSPQALRALRHSVGVWEDLRCTKDAKDVGERPLSFGE